MRVLRSKLSPGMILEENAVDRDSRMLIGKDAVITDRLIDVLETANIPIVYVTDASFAEFTTCPELPVLTDDQEREIRDRFQHVDLAGAFANAVFVETMNHAQETLVEPSEGT